MTKVLGSYLYDFVIVYLDDIIIFSQTMDEHLQYIRKVLEALRQAGLKLKLEKCEFAKKQFKYLGFIIREFGIKPDPEKVRAIVDQPVPTNQTQIRSFLEMIRFFRILNPSSFHDKPPGQGSTIYLGIRTAASLRKDEANYKHRTSISTSRF